MLSRQRTEQNGFAFVGMGDELTIALPDRGGLRTKDGFMYNDAVSFCRFDEKSLWFTHR